MADQIPLSLSETRLSLTAGASPVAVEITVGNKQQIVDEMLISVSGGQPDWYDLSRDHVPLFPDETAKVTLRVHPPQRWDVQAGETSLTVTAQSRADATVLSTATLVLQIAPTGSFEADLVKSEATGDEGVFVLRLANQSNAAMSFVISATDPAGVLDYTIAEQNLTLTPFQDRDHIEIVARRRDPKESGGRVVRFTVQVQPVAMGLGAPVVQPQRVDGTLLPSDAPVKTPMPPWLKYAAPIAAVVVIGAVIGFLSGAFVGGGGEPTPVIAQATPGQQIPTPIPTPKPGITPIRPVTLVVACRPIIRCLQVNERAFTVSSADTVNNVCQRNRPSNLTVDQCVQFVIEQNSGINANTKLSAGQTIKLPSQ